jgi:PAS domain S-box-containing protein
VTPARRFPGSISLQYKLTLTYAAVGIVIATMCLCVAHWIEERVESRQKERVEALLVAQALGTASASSFEEALTYILTGDKRDKERCFRKLELMRSAQDALRAPAANVKANAGTQLQELEATLVGAVEATHRLFADYEAGTWVPGGASSLHYDEAMDAVTERVANLVTTIQRRTFEDALASSRLLNWTLLGVGILGVLLATLMGHALGQRIVLPLRRLRDAAAEFGRGNFEALVDTSGTDETGDLARAFQAMSTDVRRLVTSVAEQKAHLEDIFESMAELVAVCGPDGTILSANRAIFATLGYQERELLGRPIDELLQTSSFEELQRRARSLAPATEKVGPSITLRTKDGLPIPVLASATILSARAGTVTAAGDLLLVLQDLREWQRLEDELRQAQKLESIGRLASGIAHEINTPVQFVSDSLAFIAVASRDLMALVEKNRLFDGMTPQALADFRRQTLELEETLDYPYLVENLPPALGRMTEGLQRIASIVLSMKQFAHPDQKQRTMVDLNAAVQSTITIARGEYKYVADLETDLGELPLIACFAGELNQVVLNILVNAAHAIGDLVKGTDQRGRIVVRTHREGEDAIISVSDTGGGIPQLARDRIFEPFFTTKEVGRGTGQGLAIARSVVVDKHGGTLTFETEVGKGTTFFIRLPINEANVPAHA